ncbi:GAF domain-containing protein [Chloroflexales bacterium ZM16-3]|nr:GAF domain-containing protein [Chloroflexales bacterium ZM16-3]
MGRLQALYRCAIIDTVSEAPFNDLASLAASSCQAPIALIGFIDDHREWFKAQVGFDLSELPINQSLDVSLLTLPEPLILSDALSDPRFSTHPLVLSESPIRFYASAPIRSSDGFVIGAIAVADYTPRELSPQQQQTLSTLANQVGALLELRALHQIAGERRQQALLIDLGRRALGGEPINSLVSWMVDQVAHVLEVDRCYVLELLPNNKALPRASFGWGTAYSPNNAMPLSDYLLAAATLQSGQPIVINSLSHETCFGGPEILQLNGVESGVSLIIRGDPRPYGMLGIYSVQQRNFTRADVAFLQALADVLAEAISQQQRRQSLDEVVNLSRILRQAATRSEMMRVILSRIHAVCHSVGSAIILSDADGRASVAQGRGIWEGATGKPIPPGDSPSWHVLLSGQPFLGNTPDFQLDDTAPQDRALACVALKYNDQPIGVLWVAYASVISYYDQNLLVALADTVASAINRSNLHDQTIRLYQERQQLTKEVRRIERHLASTVESAIDLVVSTDTEGRIMTWNRAAERISGFTREQMVGQHLYNLCAPAHRAMMEEMIKILMEGASFGQIELPLIGTTHQDVPISWRLSAIQSDTGGTVGIVAVGRDLAEQRHLESQLFQAAKMASMGVMASGIGHELRNPLGVISANAQLALERLSDPEIIRTCLQQIHVATKRSSLIIDNLLTFARPRNEGSQIVDINEVLASTFMLLDYQIQQHRTKLNATLSHSIPKVAGNAALLQQVFTNVILNALQAMEGGGMLNVTTQASDELGVEIVFSDTGCGISPEVLPQIFDPFFTTRPLGQGTGLGLAISYSIIQQHGGTIETSSPSGEGCTFYICLPAAPVS